MKSGNIIKRICIFSVVLLIVFVGGFSIYYTLLKSNKNIVKEEFRRVFASSKREVKKSQDLKFSYDLDHDKVFLSGHLGFDSKYRGDSLDLSHLKDYGLDYSFLLDKNNNKMSSSMSLGDDESILDVLLDVEKDQGYLSLPGVYDKVIHFVLDSEIQDIKSTDVELDDILKILDKTEKYSASFIRDKDISSKYEKTEIDGEKRNCYKITYKFDQVKYLKGLFEYYRYDEDTLDVIAKLFNTKKYEVEDVLREWEKKLDKEKEDIIEIHSYADIFFKKIVRVDIDYQEDEVSFVLLDDSCKVSILSNKKEVGHGVINYRGKKMDFDFDLEDEGLIHISYSYKKGENHFEVSQDGEDDFHFFVDWKNKVSKSKVDSDVSFKISYVVDQEKIDFQVFNTMTLSRDGEFDEFDKDEIINIEDIGTSEMLEMVGKIEDKFFEIFGDFVADSSSLSSFRMIVD